MITAMERLTEEEAQHIAWHNGVMEEPKQTAFSLWIAGSRAEIIQWLQSQEIPFTVGKAWKGKYIGFRDTYGRAIERHAQRMERVYNMEIDKNDTAIMEIRLDPEAWVAMTTEKVFDFGYTMRLHYVSYPGDPVDWGVWYYHGKNFCLHARGVYVFRPRAIV